jgi:hypothetical protein
MVINKKKDFANSSSTSSDFILRGLAEIESKYGKLHIVA